MLFGISAHPIFDAPTATPKQSNSFGSYVLGKDVFEAKCRKPFQKSQLT